MTHPRFDRSGLRVRPLDERNHDLDISCIRPLAPVPPEKINQGLAMAGRAMAKAKETDAASILMIGGHVLRSGVQPHIIDLMERGLVTCLAMNGAVMIHDFEMALIGATTESVEYYIKDGRFGLWEETGRINDLVTTAWRTAPESGLGEAVGQAMLGGDFPHKEISLLAQAARLGVPATVHVAFGQDIIHEHPNFHPESTGRLTYNDFLTYTAQVANLDGGVIMNFGTAVMGPEVYLKALSMARNAASAEGRSISRFTSLVCDLKDIPESPEAEPPKGSAAYYFRPWKTMLVRTVADGGQGRYVRGPHAETVPALWSAALRAAEMLD